jgi:hypothetical protein
VANTLNQQAHCAEASPCVDNITVKLPDFDRKGNMDIWIKKVECIISGCNYPEDRWTSMIITSLKDTAEAFWFNLISEMGVNNMPWETFKRCRTPGTDRHGKVYVYQKIP